MKHMIMKGSLALVAAAMSFPSLALESTQVINLELAQKIAAGCQKEAHKHGWKMSVTVVDAGANPVYFQRMDGAYIASGEIATQKAQNSAKMQLPTSALEEFSFGKDKKGGPAPGLAHVPGFVTLAGGVPITSTQSFIGAVGVSGGMPNDDEACALAGLAAVKSQLK